MVVCGLIFVDIPIPRTKVQSRRSKVQGPRSKVESPRSKSPKQAVLTLDLRLWTFDFRYSKSLKLMFAAYSVEIVSNLFSSAACSVCQASVAHLTRIGNSLTP